MILHHYEEVGGGEEMSDAAVARPHSITFRDAACSSAANSSSSGSPYIWFFAFVAKSLSKPSGAR